MKPPRFKPETILIADLLEYLERHNLRVAKVELWLERGLMVWTENDNNAEHSGQGVANDEVSGRSNHGSPV